MGSEGWTIVTLGERNDSKINACLESLATVYRTLGISVVRLFSKTDDAIFHRDVFAWTPYGLIKARMGKSSRAWEPDAWFDGMRLEPSLVIESPATFEGADLVWVNEDYALIAYGTRTNLQGALTVADWLRSKGCAVTTVCLPAYHDQHLLGVCNVANGLIFAYEPLARLFDWIQLPFAEYPSKGANWVAIGRQAIVPATCPNTAALLGTYGLTPTGVGINPILAHGGGVACASGLIRPYKPIT